MIAWVWKIGSKRNGRMAIKMYREVVIYEGTEILKASVAISGIETNTETWIHPVRCQLL